MARGIRWKIGNGQSVNIRRDPWLRDSGNFYITTILNEEHRSLMVRDLFEQDSRQWKFTLLDDMFQTRDHEETLKIPLPLTDINDIRVWHYDRNGIYTVKSWYNHIMGNMGDTTNMQSTPTIWTQIWNIRAPPKVKFFMWRVARNCIPNRQNLRNRGIDVLSCCALCGSGIENNWHLFVDCSYAQNCWKLANLLQLVNECASNSDSFSQWLVSFLKRCQPHTTTMAMILWSIWYYRNEKVWNNIDRPTNINISMASDLLHQWLKAQTISHPQYNSSMVNGGDIRWERPPSGFMKCNIDAAIFKELRMTGGAAIIRDHDGEFMVCRIFKHQGVLDAREAEAKALLEALNWATSMDLQHVIFETDAKLVVDAIQSNPMDHSEFGTIIAECCSLISAESNYQICFSKRQANVVAHTLARAANSYASPYTCFDAPDFISAYLFLSGC